MYNKAKIIIVDDHFLFREGMKHFIEKEDIGVVIAEAENGREFLDLLGKHKPDIVLMDLDMPVMGGLEATKKAIAIRPELKIIAVTMFNRHDKYIEMIKAGAMGYVLKNSGKQELAKAIKTVIGGESYFSNAFMQQIIMNSTVQHLIHCNSVGIQGEYTEREFEILQYICKGLTANEIAAKIFRSVKTIEAHRSKLLEKTNTKNSINLVLYAIKNKLVEISDCQ